jgi:glycosyltransferase involved in cell wall biosynthesis
METPKTLRILGTRGIPAAHGGFETFAERLALYLRDHGWRVIVYCQEEGSGPTFEDRWEGIERVRIPVAAEGPKGTILFDWKATWHAAARRDLCLTLGYNTAVFCAVLRARGIPNLINMDGIEWSRAKWSGAAKSWFWLNDWAGCWLGNHLVADHPEIKEHLATRVSRKKITTIAYGGDTLFEASEAPVRDRGLEPGGYLTLVARAEPENSILEVVSGFSAARRGVKLAVLGNYDAANAYHRAVRSAASDEVVFLGAIYDRPIVQALRFHSMAYVHGHQVGGTNPSLVEALGAGNAVIAHDNRFNRWVAGAGARYFLDARGFAEVLEALLADPDELQSIRRSGAERFLQEFTWAKILGEYESLLERYLRPGAPRAAKAATASAAQPPTTAS